MGIELAKDQNETTDDDQPNERGIMDFGRWITVDSKQRFWPVCKSCGHMKHPATCEGDLECMRCIDGVVEVEGDFSLIYR